MSKTIQELPQFSELFRSAERNGVSAEFMAELLIYAIIQLAIEKAKNGRGIRHDVKTN